MIDSFFSVIKFLFSSPEAIATYLVGIIAIIGGVFQLRRNLVLNKKSKVFDDLSAKITNAKSLIMDINKAGGDLIGILGQEADAAANFANNLSNADYSQREAEIDRRSKQISEVADKQKNHISAIFNAQIDIIKIVEEIDKSTVISKSSKYAAKYVFFAASEQVNLTSKANEVIVSLNVVPPIGDVANISPQTFQSIVQLYNVIRSRYSEIMNYLDDLEVILHNDLVKDLFGEAAYPVLHDKTLTTKGIVDHRAKKPLR